MKPLDPHEILERAGADPNAPEGSQARALAQVDEVVTELLEKVSCWRPIETAPEVKGDCFWCLLAWGPEGDKATGTGFRWNEKWFAAGCFYRLNQPRKFEWREVEVEPTHWAPHPDAPQ